MFRDSPILHLSLQRVNTGSFQSIKLDGLVVCNSNSIPSVQESRHSTSEKLARSILIISSDSHWEIPTVLYNTYNTCKGRFSFVVHVKDSPTGTRTRPDQVKSVNNSNNRILVIAMVVRMGWRSSQVNDANFMPRESKQQHKSLV